MFKMSNHLISNCLSQTPSRQVRFQSKLFFELSITAYFFLYFNVNPHIHLITCISVLSNLTSCATFIHHVLLPTPTVVYTLIFSFPFFSISIGNLMKFFYAHLTLPSLLTQTHYQFSEHHCWPQKTV